MFVEHEGGAFSVVGVINVHYKRGQDRDPVQGHHKNSFLLGWQLIEFVDCVHSR
jgi:hypothetical protein